MVERYGVILLDNTELIIRIYEADNAEWRLVHYVSKDVRVHKPDFILSKDTIVLTIADVFSSQYAQHIAEWKVCARNVSQKLANEVHALINLPIESLTPIREQELLCKGLFTELW